VDFHGSTAGKHEGLPQFTVDFHGSTAGKHGGLPQVTVFSTRIPQFTAVFREDSLDDY
jgi:hypothetical protein